MTTSIENNSASLGKAEEDYEPAGTKIRKENILEDQKRIDLVKTIWKYKIERHDISHSQEDILICEIMFNKPALLTERDHQSLSISSSIRYVQYPHLHPAPLLLPHKGEC